MNGIGRRIARAASDVTLELIEVVSNVTSFMLVLDEPPRSNSSEPGFDTKPEWSTVHSVSLSSKLMADEFSLLQGLVTERV